MVQINLSLIYSKNDLSLFQFIHLYQHAKTYACNLVEAHTIVLKEFSVGHMQSKTRTSRLFNLNTPRSTVNELKITSDKETVTLTPDTATEITFVIHAPSPPQSHELYVPDLVWRELYLDRR